MTAYWLRQTEGLTPASNGQERLPSWYVIGNSPYDDCHLAPPSPALDLAYEGEARGLIALHQYAAARKALDEAIEQAQRQSAFAAEAQLLVVEGLGDMVTQPAQAIQDLQQATAFCKQHNFQHVLAWATFELATAYRRQGDPAQAWRYAALAEQRTGGGQ